MIAIAKHAAAAVHLPFWGLPRLSNGARRRKQATIDLIHSSPHLLRDIGATEGHLGDRRRS